MEEDNLILTATTYEGDTYTTGTAVTADEAMKIRGVFTTKRGFLHMATARPGEPREVVVLRASDIKKLVFRKETK